MANTLPIPAPNGIRNLPSADSLMGADGNSLGLVTASAMQATTTWAAVFAQTTDPAIRGVPWNNGNQLVFSVGGISAMTIGTTFEVG